MENGDIPNENIQASGELDDFPASDGRLNGPSNWSWHGDRPPPWIQADIGYQTHISGVITQGDGGRSNNPIYIDWLTSLKISTFEMSSYDVEVFVTDEDGIVKVNEKTNNTLSFDISKECIAPAIQS